MGEHDRTLRDNNRAKELYQSAFVVDAKLPHIGDGMRPCRRSGRRGQSLDRASVSDVVDSRWYSDPTLLGATDVDLA